MCPRCKDKVSRVEQAGLGSIFLCTQGGSRFVYRERERLQVRYIYSERMSEKVREERERQSNRVEQVGLDFILQCQVALGSFIYIMDNGHLLAEAKLTGLQNIISFY